MGALPPDPPKVDAIYRDKRMPYIVPHTLPHTLPLLDRERGVRGQSPQKLKCFF
jgi:hypothetical protein